jgi:hypothetical protein
MQSESNHIDNFFRRKEAVSIADKSNVDAHWKQMQEMLRLQPAPKTSKTINYKIFLQYAAIVLLVAAGLFLVFQNNKDNKSITIKPSNEKNSLPSLTITDRHVSDSLTPIPTNRSDIKLVKSIDQIKEKSNRKEEKSDELKDGSSYEKLLPPDNKSLVVTKEEIKHDNASVFKKFNADISKQAEHFIINPSSDTTLTCKEGTTVFIPANTFQTLAGRTVSGPVTIAVKEFYSVADIISNNLATTSNGKQLITGGMLNISVFANDQPLQIKQDAFIDLKMPTRVFNSDMQLFTGVENMVTFTSVNEEKSILKGIVDTVAKTIRIDTVSKESSSTVRADFFSQQGINWIPAGQQQFFIDDKKKEITLFDVQDNSRVVYRGNKSIAKYLIPHDCPLTVDEMETILRSKYGKWYDNIKVRKAWKPLSKKRRVTYPTDWIYDEYFVGDSLVIPLKYAMRRKMITREDSLRYEMEFKKKYEEAVKRGNAYNDFVLKKNAYDFRITGLGWINCDRFLNYPPGRLSEFYVNTPEGFQGIYFASMLIFEKNRSAMGGYWNANGRISFSKIPLGETVNLVCLGAKDGKMYAAVQQFSVERDPKIVLKLEEITPEEFKEKLSRFGNVQGIN